eukprot:356754-Chlamydomonas_euryale.AAC.1
MTAAAAICCAAALRDAAAAAGAVTGAGAVAAGVMHVHTQHAAAADRRLPHQRAAAQRDAPHAAVGACKHECLPRRPHLDTSEAGRKPRRAGCHGRPSGGYNARGGSAGGGAEGTGGWVRRVRGDAAGGDGCKVFAPSCEQRAAMLQLGVWVFGLLGGLTAGQVLARTSRPLWPAMHQFPPHRKTYLCTHTPTPPHTPHTPHPQPTPRNPNPATPQTPSTHTPNTHTLHTHTPHAPHLHRSIASSSSRSASAASSPTAASAASMWLHTKPIRRAPCDSLVSSYKMPVSASSVRRPARTDARAHARTRTCTHACGPIKIVLVRGCLSSSAF